MKNENKYTTKFNFPTPNSSEVIKLLNKILSKGVPYFAFKHKGLEYRVVRFLAFTDMILIAYYIGKEIQKISPLFIEEKTKQLFFVENNEKIHLPKKRLFN